VCPNLCVNSTGKDLIDYINWILSTCNVPISTDSVANFTDEWVNLPVLGAIAEEKLIPWAWRVVYSAADDQRPEPRSLLRCPSNSKKLGAFALVNAITFCATIVFGRRTLLHKLSCGKLGNPGSPHWASSALVFTGLSLLANTANALIIRATPGFQQVSVSGLVLLWCSRPRIAWAGVILFFVEKEKAVYFSTGASAVFSEIVLQCIGRAPIEPSD
jgi:hypothetical protein